MVNALNQNVQHPGMFILGILLHLCNNAVVSAKEKSRHIQNDALILDLNVVSSGYMCGAEHKELETSRGGRRECGIQVVDKF